MPTSRVLIFVGVVLLIASAIVFTLLPLEKDDVPHSDFVPDGYALVFNDEFEQTGLNEEVWKHRYVNESYRAGVISERSVSQPGDGFLYLSTLYENEQFLTGMLQSVPQFKYGYFEARIRFQQLQGHHGAFWLQSPKYGEREDNPGYSGAEIDIVEFFGTGRAGVDVQQHLYWNEYESEALRSRSNNIFYRQQYGAELSDEFHIFALLWTEYDYVFYIDGIETWRSSDGLSHTEQYIVLSLTTSEWENPQMDVGNLPDYLSIDYVRVYSR